MRVFVTGGTGLIGRHLVKRLLERGDQPVILSRRADEVRRDRSMRGHQFVQGDPTSSGAWESAVDGCDAVITLAGHGIFTKRWNPSIKRQIRDSRVYATEHVVRAIANAKKRPAVLVQGSAIGYYGIRGDEELTEESNSGSDFMAVVCREWEDAVHPAELLGVRVPIVRTGIVLAKGEGALGVMTPIFKAGGAAPIGSGGTMKPGTGQQWMSWIHLDDIVGIFLFALDNERAMGPINGTSPNPVRNAEFAKKLASVLHRPCLPVGPPDAVLNVILGQVAEIVTTGQRVLPTKARELGYHFKYPHLLEALRDVFAKREAPPQPKPQHVATGAHH